MKKATRKRIQNAIAKGKTFEIIQTTKGLFIDKKRSFRIKPLKKIYEYNSGELITVTEYFKQKS